MYLQCTFPSDQGRLHPPINFAALLSARRNTKDNLRIPDLIHKTQQQVPRPDHPCLHSRRRTPLHMAVSGPSSLAAEWILQQHSRLLEAKDDKERTPIILLHLSSQLQPPHQQRSRYHFHRQVRTLTLALRMLQQ